MTRSLLCLATASVFAFSTPARADEVVLQDGRILYGAVQQAGAMLTISTRDGDVSVPRDEVVRIRSNAELRVELLGLAARCGNLSAFSCLNLAHTAREWNLTEQMWHYLDRALERPDMPADVRARLEEFTGTLEPELLSSRWRKSPPATKAREILFALPARTTSPARAAAAARVLSSLTGIERELKVRARSLPRIEQRAVANEALWLRADDGSRNFVLRSAVFDDAPAVRTKAIALARASAATKTAADYIAKWLVHEHARNSIRAAEALAELAEPAAVDALVKAGPFAAASGEYGVRANAAFITQQAYIRDFDVEVAQASFIADPKVDALTYGSVLDVRVPAVTTQRVQVVAAFRNAITKLEGADPGRDPAKWEDWLASRRNAAK